MVERIHNKVDLATEQLDLALSLFLEDRSFVSVVTLAGAAEEIFGKALSHEGKNNSLNSKYEALAPTYTILDANTFSKKSFIEEENRARNGAKHMDDPNVATVTVDLEDAALWMIVRACDNFNRLGLPRSERMIEFDNWFHQNIVGY